MDGPVWRGEPRDAIGDVDLAAVARLIGDRARARMLLALCAGHRLDASTLAAHAGLSAPATTSHLRQLLAGGLVTVDPAGRHRYYAIAHRDVAAALEALARLAPARPVRSLHESRTSDALRFARVCYDHLAGDLAVAVVDALIERDAIRAAPTPAAAFGDAEWSTGPRLAAVLSELRVVSGAGGVNDAPTALHPCLDWSAGRPHLAGALGALLLTTFRDHGWLRQATGSRTVRATPLGRRELRATLGVVT